MIEVNIKKAYYDIDSPVFSNFSMSVSRGETVSIVGQSGIGKSTLLKIIAGLHNGYEGQVALDRETRFALIPQNEFLLPWKTVYENVILLARTEARFGYINAGCRQKAFDLINKLGLSGLEKQYPHKLSGGQYKRAALGQALFYGPDVILMDEPFSGLDGMIKKEIQDLFLRMRTESGITVVFVTHDMGETEYMDSRVVRLGEI